MQGTQRGSLAVFTCSMCMGANFATNFCIIMFSFLCRFWSTDWLLWAVFVTSTINLLFLTMQLYFAISKIEKLDVRVFHTYLKHFQSERCAVTFLLDF